MKTLSVPRGRRVFLSSTKKWDIPTLNGRSLAPIGQNDLGPSCIALKLLLLPFERYQIYCLQPEILTIKVR